jgi:TolB-like protein/tetratricopeptide (TPR) repeat protein
MGAASPDRVSTPTGAVFLSYASQDAQAAQKISEALRAAGIEVWFDKSELRGGDVWDRQIREKIHDCRLFIPVISASTEARDEGYFRREWGLATDRTRDMAEKRAFLIPVVIDDTPERGSSVPDKFHQIQWTRLPGGVTPPGFVARVAALLGVQSPAATANNLGAAPVSAPPARTRNRRAVWIPVGIASLAVVIAGSWLVWQRSGLHRHVEVAVAGPLSAVTEKSIAVLPFVDMSEKHDQEYLADGLAEEVLDELANVPGLRVIARTSAFQLKGQTADIRSVGSKLGAAHVVEGSVRKSGDHVRVTVQLIRTADGAHEWSESFDRELADSLELKRTIAATIARALQVSVQESTGESGGTKNPEANDLYMRGLQAFQRTDRPGFEQAASFFERAIDIDPAFQRAAESLARVHYAQADFGLAARPEGWVQARSEAQKLVERYPQSVVGHYILARIYSDYDWNWDDANREIVEIGKLDPHSSLIDEAVAMLQMGFGNWPEAEKRFRANLALDPLNADDHLNLGIALFGAHRYSEAADEHRRTIAINPTTVTAHYVLAGDLLALGQQGAALEELKKESVEGYRLGGLVCVYHALRRSQDSDAEFSQLIRESTAHTAYETAIAYACRGDRDRAFQYFDRSFAQREFDLTNIKADWPLADIRGDPRYAALLRKMNLPE